MGSKRGPMWASAPTASEEGCSVALLPEAKVPHAQPPSSFPNADRCAGSAFGFLGDEGDGGRFWGLDARDRNHYNKMLLIRRRVGAR